LWKQGIDSTIANTKGIPVIQFDKGVYLEDFLKKRVIINIESVHDKV
jgi:hypothetical protein